jgi:hypothetical protein
MLLTPPTSASVSNAPSEIDANKANSEPAAETKEGTEGLEADKDDIEDKNRRKSVRSRNVVPTYNDKYLSGHAVHTRKSYRVEGDKWSEALKDMDSLKRTVSGVTLVNDDADSPSKQLLAENNKAFDTEEAANGDATPKSNIITRRKSVRATVTNAMNTVASASTVLGKRTRDAFETTKGRMTRSTAPKPVKPEPRKSPAKKRMFPNLSLSDAEQSSEEEEDSDEESDEDEELVEKRPRKFWMSQGLYVGQTREDSRNKGKGRKSEIIQGPERTFLPLPMYTGARLLEAGRDFKLPYEILNPLPKTEHPKDWKNITKSKFNI